MASQPSNDSRIALRDLLDKHFSLGKLRSLAFELGIDYENIAGDTKRNKFEYLIWLMGKDARIVELIDYASDINLSVEWPDVDWTAMDWSDPPNMTRWVIVPKTYAEDIETQGPTPGEPPYKGLVSFKAEDAHIFFGRNKLIAQLVAALNETRILVIVGASGSGKSSIVRAGVVPALTDSFRRDGVPLPLEKWATLLITPTAEPLDSYVAGLYSHPNQIEERATLRQKLHGEDRYSLSNALNEWGMAIDRKPLLVIDQFEELFTQCKEESVRKLFIRQIEGLLNHAEGTCKAILTLRADFYDECLRYPFLKDILTEHQAIVGAMTDKELEETIIQPAHLGNWKIQVGMVDLMLKEVGNEPGRLPLLSHALRVTWEKRRGLMLTLSGYNEAGGVNGAIAKTAETTYKKLTDKQKSIAKQLLLDLTELGEGSQDTRRRVRIDELTFPAVDDEDVAVVIRTLTQARLVTADKLDIVNEPSSPQNRPNSQHIDTFEVAHEALIREWPLLREWLDQSRDGLRLQRQIDHEAREWLDRDQSPDYLTFRGARLENTFDVLGEKQLQLSERAQAFINACQVAEAAEQADQEKFRQEQEAARQKALQDARELARATEEKLEIEESARRQAEDSSRRLKLRNRWVFTAAGIAVLLFIISIIFASQAKSNKAQVDISATAIAEQQAQLIREEAIALARISSDKLSSEHDPTEAVLFAIESLKITDAAGLNRVTPAEQTLRDALASLDGIALPLAHELSGIGFDPFERWLITGHLIEDDKAAVRVWDLEAENPTQPIAELTSNARLTTNVGLLNRGIGLLDGTSSGAAHCCIDNQYLMTFENDSTLHLWDMSKAVVPNTPDKSILVDSKVIHVTFTSQNPWFVTISESGEALLWDSRQSQLDPISVDFSPSSLNESYLFAGMHLSENGRWLVSTTEDNQTRLLDLQRISPTQAPEETLPGVPIFIGCSGDCLLTYDAATTVAFLWDLTHTSPKDSVKTISNFADVFPVSISPDWKWMLTLPNYGDPVYTLLNLAIENPEDRQVTLLTDLEQPYLGVVFEQFFTEDSQWLIGGGIGGKVYAWDMSQGSTPLTPEVLAYSASTSTTYQSLRMAPNSEILLASDNGDDRIHIWDMRGDQPISLERSFRFSYTLSTIDIAAISPHNRWVVLREGGFLPEGALRVIDLSDASHLGDPQVEFDDAYSQITTMSVSADGNWIAAGRWGQLIFWDAADLREPVLTLVHENNIDQILFDPNGQWIAVVNGNQVRIWDIANGINSSAPNYIDLPQFERGIDVMETSNNGRWLMVLTRYGPRGRPSQAIIWDLHASPPLAIWGEFSPDRFVTEGALCHSSQCAALRYSDGTIGIIDWDEDGSITKTDLPVESPEILGIDSQDHYLYLNNSGKMYQWNLVERGSLDVGNPLNDGNISIIHVAFSSSGDWMLSVGPETALLWDLTNGNPVLFDLAAKDSGYIDRILPALNFEETSLLMFSEGSHVELWYLEDILGSSNPSPIEFAGYNSALLHPNNEWLIMWNRLGGTPPVLWRLDLAELVAHACKTVGRNLSESEWILYYPDRVLPVTCPNF